VDVDDAFVAAIEFENGAIGTLEGSRLAAGRQNHEVIEINGEKGSVRWNLERMNELELYRVEDESGSRGFRSIMLTEPDHPFITYWWPPGHILGWEHNFVHEIAHLLDCIANDRDVGPEGATFKDGYKACVVTDAILESSDSRRMVDVAYNL
jgi:predicted dehydrogenase